MTPIPIRAHHLLCLQGFQGKGYSPAFTKRFAESLAELNSAPDTECEVITSTDAFCAPCPHGDGPRCAKDFDADRRMRARDFSVLAKLEMPAETLADFASLITRVNARLKNRADVGDICGDCAWRSDCSWYKSLKP